MKNKNQKTSYVTLDGNPRNCYHEYKVRLTKGGRADRRFISRELWEAERRLFKALRGFSTEGKRVTFHGPAHRCNCEG